ncbi:MAG: sensor histidine kinase [Chthoniobacterales bacterium]
MAETPSENQPDPLRVPWTDVVGFVRQISHDLRNYLNAADLTAAYINEIADNAEVKTETKRLRESIAAAAAALQKISATLGKPRITLLFYRATELMDDLRKKIETEFRDQGTEVVWDIEPTDAGLEIDPQLLQQVFVELFGNALRHNRGNGPLLASGKIDNQRFVFTLREPKTRFDLPTENWGGNPLHSVGPGHYGLGLHRARAIIEAHRGDFHARYEPGESVLVTTITLPLSA